MFTWGQKVKGRWHGLDFTGLFSIDTGAFVEIVPSNQTMADIFERRRLRVVGLPVFQGVMRFEKADAGFSIEADLT